MEITIPQTIDACTSRLKLVTDTLITAYSLKIIDKDGIKKKYEVPTESEQHLRMMLGLYSLLLNIGKSLESQHMSFKDFAEKLQKKSNQLIDTEKSLLNTAPIFNTIEEPVDIVIEIIDLTQANLSNSDLRLVKFQNCIFSPQKALFENIMVREPATEEERAAQSEMYDLFISPFKNCLTYNNQKEKKSRKIKPKKEAKGKTKEKKLFRNIDHILNTFILTTGNTYFSIRKFYGNHNFREMFLVLNEKIVDLLIKYNHEAKIKSEHPLDNIGKTVAHFGSEPLNIYREELANLAKNIALSIELSSKEKEEKKQATTETKVENATEETEVEKARKELKKATIELKKERNKITQEAHLECLSKMNQAAKENLLQKVKDIINTIPQLQVAAQVTKSFFQNNEEENNRTHFLYKKIEVSLKQLTPQNWPTKFYQEKQEWLEALYREGMAKQRNETQTTLNDFLRTALSLEEAHREEITRQTEEGNGNDVLQDTIQIPKDKLPEQEEEQEEDAIPTFPAQMLEEIEPTTVPKQIPLTVAERKEAQTLLGNPNKTLTEAEMRLALEYQNEEKTA